MSAPTDPAHAPPDKDDTDLDATKKDPSDAEDLVEADAEDAATELTEVGELEDDTSGSLSPMLKAAFAAAVLVLLTATVGLFLLLSGDSGVTPTQGGTTVGGVAEQPAPALPDAPGTLEEAEARLAEFSQGYGDSPDEQLRAALEYYCFSSSMTDWDMKVSHDQFVANHPQASRDWPNSHLRSIEFHCGIEMGV